MGLITLLSSRLTTIFESFLVKNFTCASSSSFLIHFNPLDDTLTTQTALILKNGILQDLLEIDFDSSASANILSFFMNVAAATNLIIENMIVNNTILYSK